MIFLKIAIIEDESNEQNKLLKLLEEQNSEELKLQIEVFSSAVNFLKEFQANYDIIFLDIRMPYVDGMSCAERIRKLDKKVILVFVTSLAQYAIQGYSVNAFDYILKPVQEGSFNIKFTRILDYYIQNVSKHFISLPSENGLIKIDINDIYYFEAAEHAVIAVTKNGTYKKYDSLSRFEDILKDDGFVRSNSCYLINIKHVQEFDKTTNNLIMIDGSSLQVSRPRKKVVLEALKKR